MHDTIYLSAGKLHDVIISNVFVVFENVYKMFLVKKERSFVISEELISHKH
jgi:hypothetical protein